MPRRRATIAEGTAPAASVQAAGCGAALWPFPGVLPLNLSREEAARYVGVSPRSFDAMVEAGEMPKPIRWGGRVMWRRREIEMANDRLGADDDGARNDWDPPTRGAAP